MKSKKISLAEYCARPVLMNRTLEIMEAVQIEDTYNHRNISFIPELQNKSVRPLPKSLVIRNMLLSFIP